MIEINNLTSSSIDKSLISDIVSIILKKEGFKGKLSVAFLDEKEMQIINRQCRGKDYPTDVLSFSYLDEELLGEVIICPQKVKKSISEVLVHGVLHVLGHDHGEGMREKEKEYLSLLENKKK